MKRELMRRVAAVALSWLLLASSTWAAEATLPIRRVALYKHGVAWFAREGKLNGANEVTLEFKASEMSDVLKSLTLLAAGGAAEGVSYEASEPLARQLSQFSFSLPKDASLAQVLDQLKGARLYARLAAGGELRGSILGARRSIADKTETEIVSLLLDNGEFRSFGLNEVAALRLEDPRLQGELESYLRLVASTQRRDMRTLNIRAGSAQELTVAYAVESPVWKTSYRMVLDPNRPGEALLQAWAMVDNTTNEDWKGVTLALVSGLPVSFTQNLYQAHFMRRPNVPLPMELALGPVTHQGAVQFEKEGPLAAGQAASKMRAYRDMPAAPAAAEADLRQLNDAVARRESFQQSVAVGATGVELGELFQYRIEKPIDILRHQSAMIPFFQGAVKAERILLYTASLGGEHPYDAVILENTSGKTLDGGAITVLEGSQYEGEGLVETVKAGDSRPISFAVDVGTRVTTVFDSRQNQVFAVKIRRGTVSTRARNIEVKTYTVRNTSDRAKTLMIEHPVRPGWKLSGTLKPVEKTAKHYRFRVDLPARETAKLAVEEEFEVFNSFALTNMTPELIAEYVRNQALSPAAQKQLESMMAVKEQIVDGQRDAKAREEELAQMFRDQERLRQNLYTMRSLPGQQDQVNAYAAKLATQEKQIEAKQTSFDAARSRLAQLQAQLDRLMNTLTIE